MTNEQIAEQWDRTLVKNAIIYAYRVLRAQPGIRRPGGLAAYWPEQGSTMYADERQNRVRLHPKPHEISQSDAVLIGTATMPSWMRWLEDADPAKARLLAMWSIWMSHDCFMGGQRISEQEFARVKLKMPLATFKRHRDVAAALIAIWLQRNEVAPWVAPNARGAAKEHHRSPRYMRTEKAASGQLRELRATAPERKSTVAQN